VQPPNPNVIENNLTNQRLSMMARRYLRDLRQDAIIDYR
jgi:peptidyl-prolyl cis-trans isomerase SurA